MVTEKKKSLRGGGKTIASHCHSGVQYKSVLNVFLVHNKEYEGVGGIRQTEQRKYYKDNVNINYFTSGCGN